jgi:AcrR family transcriptional regulator
MLGESISLLESDGVVAVTARRVAFGGGTSTAAVYELFGNKAGLVRSIFYEGFERLAAELDQMEPVDDALAGVMAVFDATRRFALGSPMLFEVMFARPFSEFEPDPADYQAAERIYSHVVRRVATLFGGAVTDQKTIDAAHALVALDRGLIAMELSGILGGSSDSIERRRTAAFHATITGLDSTAVRS